MCSFSGRLLLYNLLALTATNTFQHEVASVGVLDPRTNLFEQDDLPRTSASAVVSLTKVGNDGSPVDTFPLGECEGDCDNDSECAVRFGSHFIQLFRLPSLICSCS